MGDFDVRISGVTKSHWDHGRDHLVIMKPVTVQRSVLGTEGERLGFTLSTPTQGAHLDLPNTELPLQVMAHT